MGLLSLIRAGLKPVYLGEGIAIRGPRAATALHRLEEIRCPWGGGGDIQIDQQADTQNVRCRGVADEGRMVATPALFIAEWVDPQKYRVFC